LWKYYESEEYVSHSKTTKGFIHYWYRQFQNLNLQLKFNAIRPIVPRGTWLDYGAGGGDFVRFINRKNISIIGIEPSQTARLSAANDGIELHEMSYLNTIGDSSLACITMWHVLEHISDFRDVLNTLNSKLIEGGLLIIAVPNPHSMDAKHYDEKWAAYDVPRHLWHFSEMDIQSLSDQLNLEVIRIKGMPLDSTYVSLLSEKYSNGSKLSGIIQGLRSNLMALFKKRPYSSQIYILRK
jgi:SAM-dependent methyltransferase